jgi:TRAP-type C4-dicarboxylate transport system permease small subunit
MPNDPSAADPVLLQGRKAASLDPSLLARGVKRLCGALFFAVFVIMMLEVTNRFYDVVDIRWSEETSRTLLVWFVFIGFGLACGLEHNIKSDLTSSFQLGVFRRLLDGLSLAATVLILAVLLVFGVQLAMIGANTRMVSFDLSMAFVLAAVPVGAALGIVGLLLRFFRTLAAGASAQRGL